MGDRANVVVKDGKSRVVLYTHWNGTELPNTLRTALARKERWDDGAYLTRIIFCEMVKGNETESTGFGISTTFCDGEDRVLTVNIDKQTVKIMSKWDKLSKTMLIPEFIESTITWGE